MAEKIPARMGDKILLFDPDEIDYIESMQGKNYLRQTGQVPVFYDYGRTLQQAEEIWFFQESPFLYRQHAESFGSYEMDKKFLFPQDERRGRGKYPSQQRKD